MKSIFHPDSLLMQFFTKIADFCLISFMVFTLCLPIITAGAAFTAAHKVMQNMRMDNPQPVIRTFLRSFAKNFKQATLFWLMTLLIVAFLLVYLSFIYVYFTGSLDTFLYVVAVIIGVVSLGTMAYAFPLVARYENSFKLQLKNAFFLAIGTLPRTIAVLLITAIPLITVFKGMEAIFNSMFAWGLMGIGILIYCQARLICPVFVRLEGNTPTKEEEDTDDRI